MSGRSAWKGGSQLSPVTCSVSQKHMDRPRWGVKEVGVWPQQRESRQYEKRTYGPLEKGLINPLRSGSFITQSQGNLWSLLGEWNGQFCLFRRWFWWLWPGVWGAGLLHCSGHTLHRSTQMKAFIPNCVPQAVWGFHQALSSPWPLLSTLFPPVSQPPGWDWRAALLLTSWGSFQGISYDLLMLQKNMYRWLQAHMINVK